MPKITESDLENFAIELLEKQGYRYLEPERQGRTNPADVVLLPRLKTAVDKLNPDIPAEAKQHALREVLNLPDQNLVESNRAFHQMLSDGVGVEYQKNGNTVGGKVRLVDFENPFNNDLLVCNQFSVTGNNITRRPDIVLLVNGLPVVVIELKNPADENATVKKAFTQLQNYKTGIPALFCYNGVLVASDGLDAKMGSLTADWSRFIAWKTVDGIKNDPRTTPQIETLIKGMLRPDVLLDLIKQFSVFDKISSEDAAGIKKPDISILSDDFLEEIRNMKQRNLAFELLNKILGDEIKIKTKKNFIQSKKLSDMLAAAIKKYHNNLLTTTQVIDELINIAKEIKAADERGEDLGLTEDEIAFYDALAVNKNAQEVLGDNTLRELARILVEQVKANTSIDWTIKESVQARLRVIVKRILREYGYPPDQEKLATKNILRQAELFANEWSSKPVM